MDSVYNTTLSYSILVSTEDWSLQIIQGFSFYKLRVWLLQRRLIYSSCSYKQSLATEIKTFKILLQILQGKEIKTIADWMEQL